VLDGIRQKKMNTPQKRTKMDKCVLVVTNRLPYVARRDASNKWCVEESGGGLASLLRGTYCCNSSGSVKACFGLYIQLSCVCVGVQNMNTIRISWVGVDVSDADRGELTWVFATKVYSLFEMAVVVWNRRI
jgi:hypothetical protein